MNSGSPSGLRRALGWLPSSPSSARDALQRVRGASMRVALISTAIVAAVYIVISVCVVTVTTSRLTGSIDSRLTAVLNQGRTACGGNLNQPEEPGQEGFGTQTYVWCVLGGGTQVGPSDNGTQVILSTQEASVTSPSTWTVDGSSMRLAGRDTLISSGFQVASGRVIVGEALTTVDSAQSNIVLAESIIGPILLIAVFLGALTIGRRVAAPIELTRIRQLEFTADASHELRTPLSVIEAQTSLALAEPRDSDWYRSAFQRVQGETGRIRRLVEDLLWLARFDSTRSQAQAEHVDVAILAHQAADRFTAIAEAKRVRLTVRTAPVPLIVHAPPEWLDRLLGVLLDNACKYVPEGGAVDVSVWAEGNRIRLNVDDNGPGIPAEERPRIFDRFHRATDRASGAGLGLAIADAVVRATAGRWLVGDSPAGGASMGVMWPRSLTGSPEPEPVTREAPTPAL